MPTASTVTKTAREAAPRIPHSWDFISWPADVWPGSGERARWLVRAHKSELLDAGAIGRVGKLIVFFGAGYARFLKRRAADVQGFESNNPAMRREEA